MSDARANKICMATLLTNDKFLPGVQVLVHSFRKHCPAEIPIIALVTDEVCKTTRFLLKRKGVKTVVVPKISRAEKSKDGAKEKHWEGAELTKLHIWNLTDYDRVLYIDADCLVMAALDELFEVDLTEHPLAAAPDVFPPDKFNAGVLVIRPSKEKFDSLVQAAKQLVSYDEGDTGFLNAYFNEWYKWPSANRLAFRYNAQRTMYWLTQDSPNYWEQVKPIKILHFSSTPKPWDCTDKKGDLEFMWWGIYREMSQA